MVTTEEIIERSFYIALLHQAIKMGYTINPEDYLVDGEPTAETCEQFLADKDAIGKKFVYVFGIGNNLVRGPKDCPRITIELNAYYPGDIGTEKWSVEESDTEDDTYDVVEYDYTTKSTQIDIHLVANTQQEMRILHYIMYKALPPKGYIKPYYNDYEAWKESIIGPTGNIYVEVGNFYDHPDYDHGLLEKVYTYTVDDSLIYEEVVSVGEIAPIKDISVLIQVIDADGITLEVS